jgi:hypothetical protein
MIRSAAVAVGLLVFAPLGAGLAAFAGAQWLAWRLLRRSLAAIATVDPTAGLAPPLP